MNESKYSRLEELKKEYDIKFQIAEDERAKKPYNILDGGQMGPIATLMVEYLKKRAEIINELEEEEKNGGNKNL